MGDVWIARDKATKSSAIGNTEEAAIAGVVECKNSHQPQPQCSAFEAIANAMRNVTEEDWEKIYAATRSRLLSSYHNGDDTKENRVLCQMDISNALFDIRDAFDEQNANNTSSENPQT
jgi:hypothetical protein